MGVVPKEQAAVPRPEIHEGDPSLPNRLRLKLGWWRQHASRAVIDILMRGLLPKVHLPCISSASPSCAHPPHSLEYKFALELVREYLDIGSLQSCLRDDITYLVPWFIVLKKDVLPDGQIVDKGRFVVNLKRPNSFLQTKHFTLDHWGNVFPFLRRGQWGAKIDLKHAYFHIPLSENFQKYVGICVDGSFYKFTALPFGLNIAPQVFMLFMRPLIRLWRSQGIMVFVYLDDIFIVANSKDVCASHVQEVRRVLSQAGFLINEKKCVDPTQLLEFLGIGVDFESGFLTIPPHKRRSYKKDMGKLITHSSISLRSAASILGKLRSLLICFPGLRLLTDELSSFVQGASFFGYEAVLPIPKRLKAEVERCAGFLSTWRGRHMLGDRPTRILASDASDRELGAIDLHTHQTVHAYVPRPHLLHINEKELQASALAVRSLARPGDYVHLKVDNTTTYFYLLRQGGRLRRLNNHIKDLFLWCWHHQVRLDVEWVKSEDNPADVVSRQGQDHKEVALSPSVFWLLVTAMGCPRPPIDLFASRRNSKCPNFVGRYPSHHPQQLLVNSLTADLSHLRWTYACPPWKVILPFLARLPQFQSLRVMMVLPFWERAPWFPLLLQLLDPRYPVLRVCSHQGMFLNCCDEPMSAPRWDLICVCVSGKFWHQRITLKRRLTHFWRSMIVL